jgi:hypothetical protein
MTPDLEGLLARVEKATGPDRELDGFIYGALGFQIIQRWGGYEWRPEGRGVWRAMPSPTTSLDAALALVERKLPGWYRWVGDLDPSDPRAVATLAAGRPDQPSYRGYAPHGQYALAVCCALLRALIAEQADG